MRSYFLPRIIYWAYRLWTMTLSVRLQIPDEIKERLEKREPVIFAHWHGHELAIIHLVTSLRIATMTSTSKDGSLVDYVINRLGGATSRGSSTRGSVQALKGLVRICKSGKFNPSMAVDGPKGPIHKVKPGVFALARLSQFPIVPVGVACSRPLVFKKSWNKAIMPMPFSRVVVNFEKPLSPPDKSIDLKDQQMSLDLESRIWISCEHATNTI